MHKDLQEIPRRIRELREILEISTEDMAKKLHLGLSEYEGFESGDSDIPIGTLFEIAGLLEIDFTELITGEAPKMDTYTVTRRGKGAQVQRYPGYNYISLAYNFIGREMEPLLVTLCADDEAAPLVTHGGQEFNFVLSGTVNVQVGGKDHILTAGDCIYFDPNLPHGQSAVEGSAAFLTVIKE